MNNLQTLLARNDRTIIGNFRMRHPKMRRTRDDRPYLDLVLEDMSGAINAVSWQPQEDVQRFRDLNRVSVEGRLRYRQDGPVGDLSRIQSHGVEEWEVVRLIPQSICPLPSLLPFLQAAVSRLTISPLSRFVQTVLRDDGIAFLYVSAPASLTHHHNYPGGLLKHSLECARMVERYQEFPREQRELGIVSALFHDIGKTLTMTSEMKRTSLGHTLDHDKLTFEVLAPFLKILDAQWPEGAIQLRYLLTWKPGQKVPRFNMADVVSCCDRVSSGLERQRRISAVPCSPRSRLASVWLENPVTHPENDCEEVHRIPETIA